MGANECDRMDCENVMCDHLILSHSAYICNRCFDELLEYRRTWPQAMTEREVEQKIREFMQTAPGHFKVLEGAEIDEVFRRLTGDS